MLGLELLLLITMAEEEADHQNKVQLGEEEVQEKDKGEEEVQEKDKAGEQLQEKDKGEEEVEQEKEQQMKLQLLQQLQFLMQMTIQGGGQPTTLDLVVHITCCLEMTVSNSKKSQT